MITIALLIALSIALLFFFSKKKREVSEEEAETKLLQQEEIPYQQTQTVDSVNLEEVNSPDQEKPFANLRANVASEISLETKPKRTIKKKSAEPVKKTVKKKQTDPVASSDTTKITKRASKKIKEA
jgi:hypothetical protein